VTPWPPEFGVRTVAYYSAKARSLRNEARGAMLLLLVSRVAAALRRFCIR